MTSSLELTESSPTSAEAEESAVRPLTVVHVTQGLDMGGLEKLLVEFAKHADRSRFALHFVSLSTRGVLADEIESLGWPVTALDKGDGFCPSLFFKLGKLFRRVEADVVHCHDERPHIYAAGASRLGGVRHVLQTRHRGLNLAVSRRQAWMLRFATRLTDRYICVSQDCANLAIEQGIPREKVVVIPNGIDLTRFGSNEHRSLASRASGPAVVVARMSPEKDIATLVRAVAEVVATDASFRLEVAGDGPCLPELKQLSEGLGLTDNITFLGQIREVPALLRRARLFVLPSLTEGISLTLLEAMASGLPIVTTNVGGNPEVVQADQTGLLVPSADPTALAKALLELWSKPERLHQFGEAGRQRVEKHFDIRKMVATYEEMYSQCSLRSGE